MSNGFEEYIAEAQNLAENDDIDGAIEMYKAALTESPTHEEIRREVINLVLDKSDFQQAIVEYFDWAEACQVEGAIDDAIRIYQEILELDMVLQNKLNMLEEDIARETIAQIQEIIQSASGAIFFNMGYLFLEKGTLDEAISCLQKSLSYNPSDAKTHALLGQVFMQKGMDKEAIGEFQEVVRLAPDEAAYAYEMLGEIFIRGGKPPQSTIVWFRNAGDLYVRHQQFDEAIRAYERILSFEEKNKDVLSRLGEIYAQQGDNEKASYIYDQLADIFTSDGLLDKVIQTYEKLLEWNPDNNDARDKIINIYRRILEMDPSNLSARSKLIGNILRKGKAEDAIPEFLALSETYLDKGMRKESFAVCKKLLDLDPKNSRAHELIADIFFDQGAKEKALPEYLMVIKLYQEEGEEEKAAAVSDKVNHRFPGTKEVTVQLAASYKERGDLNMALQEYQKLLNNDPTNIEILSNMLELLEELEDYDNVLAFSERIVALDPSRKEYLDKIIQIYSNKENWDKVLELYSNMLEEDPSRSDIRDRIMEIYENLGNQEKVIEMCQQILEIDSDRVDIRQKMIEFHASGGCIDEVLKQSSALADIFLRSEDYDKAESLYKNVLAFMPGDLTIRERLCDIYRQRGEEEKVEEELLVLANISVQQGNIESSISRYRNVLTVDSDDINIKIKIAQLAGKSGNTHEAVNQYKDIASLYMDKKMTEPALDVIGKILDVDEENIEYRQKLIEILKEQLKIEESIKHYKILLSHFLKMDQKDEAINAANEATALLPMDLDLRRDISELFLEGDDIENGRMFAEELVNLYLNRSEYGKVIDIYERLSGIYRDMEDMKSYYEFRENIAQIYERQASFQQAISEYVSILESSLMESRLYEAKRLFPVVVNLYLKEERPGEAVDCFREIAVKLHDVEHLPEAILVLEQMVMLQIRIEKWDQAHDTLQRMIDYYSELGDFENIIETTRRRIDLYLNKKNIPEAINEMFEIIKLHLQNEDIDSAMKQFEEVENFEPDDSVQNFRMAEILFENEYFDRAKTLYEKVLNYDPDNYDAVARVAIVFAKSGSLKDAVVYTKKIFSKGLLAEVIEAYRKSSEATEDEAQIHVNLGLFYQEMGFIEEAILEFQEAAKDTDKLLEAYNLMAICFKHEGFTDLAVRQFERALEQPGYPEEDYLLIRYNLGQTLLDNGQLQEALSAFYECYMVDINYKDISEKIQSLNEMLAAGDEG